MFSKRRFYPISSSLSATQQFDGDLLSRIRVTGATSSGTVAFEVEVGDEYSNGAGK